MEMVKHFHAFHGNPYAEVMKMDGGRAQAKYTVEAMIFAPELGHKTDKMISGPENTDLFLDLNWISWDFTWESTI